MKYFFLLLLFSFLCLGDLSAQVGINNPNPSQALDVGGKIKLADDTVSPEAGTIRYNQVAKTFEGYDGSSWTILNAVPDDGGGNVPASGTIVTSYRPISTCCGLVPVWDPIGSGPFFSSVPAGRTLYVTSITIGVADDPVNIDFRAKTSLTGDIVNRQQLNASETNKTLHFSDPNGYLLIVPSGGLVEMRFTGGMNSVINMRGFLQ